MNLFLSHDEEQKLLKLARDTIVLWVKNGTQQEVPKESGLLIESLGAFVTLHKNGQLRGCIGCMVGRGPLIETIRDMSIAACSEDSRFDPVKESELALIDIEISVLSPLQTIDDINKIEVGKHGILMRCGFNQGVLLPHVATEYGWDRETFLEHTCEKAGLPHDAWKDKETKIEIFSAQIFGEKK